MKKLFISQPMRDKTNEEIEKERQEAIREVQLLFPNEPIIVLDSFFKDAPHEAKPLWFLGKSFEVLSNADIAYFCKDWDNYRGCRMEHKACKNYNIECLYEHTTQVRMVTERERHKAQVALLKAYTEAERAGKFKLDLTESGYDEDLLFLIEKLNYR